MAEWQAPAADFEPMAAGGWRPPAKDFAPAATATPAPTVLERIVHGAMDPVVGIAQLGAQVNPKGYLSAPALRSIQERERTYEASRGPDAGTDWWRMAGNIASPINLAAGAAGGALMRGLPLLGRLGVAGGLGAATNVLQPTAGQDFGREKLSQAAIGAAAGVGGGALGEIGTSLLGKAIAGNNSAVVDRYLTGAFRQTVKPGRMAGTTIGARQLSHQDNRIVSAVDQIIADKGNIQLSDEVGNLLPSGSLPRSLRQFSEAIDQVKRNVFREYDAKALQAGQRGIQIGLMPAANMLRGIAGNRAVGDISPKVAADIGRLADTFEGRLFYSPSELQDAILQLNRIVTQDIRTAGSSPIKPVVDLLRESLDNSITNATGPGYQALKNQYGALRSIEKDVANSVQREANKMPWGSGLINFAAGEEFLRGLYMGDMKALGTAAAIKSAQAGLRYLNNPNRAIMRLFAQRSSPLGQMRQTLGEAIASSRYPTAVGGVAGAGVSNNLQPRPSITGP